MNRIIITLVTLTSFIKIQAQDQDLTIKGDNFLYIDNTYLYVNKGINLQNEQTESDDSGGITNGSNIYLRGGAQLIQGDNSSQNIGEGNVSIIVAGSANKWSYNYFGSPVSAPDNYKGKGNSETDGKYYVTQIDEPILGQSDEGKPIRLKSINSRDAEFTANWDSEQNPMVISSRYLFMLEEPGNWVAIDPERDGDMSDENYIRTGNGFAMKGLGGHDNHTKLNPYDFRGKPNNGTIKVNVKRQDDHLVLIGNPYPSILDIRKFYADNIGKIKSFRFWEAGSDKSHYYTESEGGYATMTISGSVVTPGKAVIKKFNNDGQQIDNDIKQGSKSLRAFIPVGQGFIVELTEDANNVNTYLEFNNTQRVYRNRVSSEGKGNQDGSGTGDFFRPGKDIKDDENTASIPLEYMRFRLNVGFNENTIRPLIMTFHDSATNGFDLGLEAGPMSIGSYDGLWGNKNNNYIFQAFKYDDDLTIPLYIKLKSQSFVEFNSYDYENIPDDMEILMHDLYTDLYYDLRKQNFSITLPAGDHENRFEIVFQEDSSLNQTDFNANLFKIISDNKNKKLLVYNPKLKPLKTIKLYDTSGKEVHRLIISKTSNVYEISTSNISNGVFIAQIESSENSSCSKRVIINK
jgi:hypothetical protein